VTIPAGNDSILPESNGAILTNNWQFASNTTYWFAAGVHTLGTGQFNEISPASGDTFIGAPGAVISGQGLNSEAFGDSATNVSVEYLTIEDFVPPGGQGAVNHDAGADWTVEYNTIQDNGNVQGSKYGAALMMGNGDVYEHNCIAHNGEYGLDAAGSSGTTFNYNEVSWNGISDFPDVSGCGCSGGIKFWDTTNTTVEDNYIHDNYNVGLWYDTNNAGALVQGNLLARNWAYGMIYELSYNADINANTFIDNGWGSGSWQAGGYPYGDAIYISGSGGSSAIDGGLYSTLTVSNNTFTDNWDGVVLYQNPNRLCGSGANASTGYCTLVNPSVFNTTSCPANDAGGSPTESPDYWDGCQWKVNNISVTSNTFNFNPTDIINATDTLPDITNSRCYSGANYLDTSATANQYWCGFNGQFSLGGSGSGGPSQGWTTADAMMGLHSTAGQVPDHNTWSGDTYNGPWAFQAYVQSTSTVSTDVYPHGIATTLNLAGWQSIWGLD
jgi:hypothetical protein